MASQESPALDNLVVEDSLPTVWLCFEDMMPVVEPYRDGGSDAQERVAALIRARRPGERLINLDRMLLHSVPFAEGYNFLLPKIRSELSVPPLLRELAICAVAAHTGAQYELCHHGPVFLAGGGTQAQLDALRSLESAVSNKILFDDRERPVLALTLESTRDVRISPATMKAAQIVFPEAAQIVDLVAVVSTYNMVCRFLVALEIDMDGPIV